MIRRRERPGLFPQHDTNHMSGERSRKYQQMFEIGMWGRGKRKPSIGFGASWSSACFRYRASERVIEEGK